MQLDGQWVDRLDHVRRGGDLSREHCRRLVEEMMEGRLADDVITEWLLALGDKGECVDELVGAAEAMRARVVPVKAPLGAIDTCGTGGDGVDTFNVSTAAAIVIAACGVPVAKHGNRSNRRSSGSTDVLEALGIDINAPIQAVERTLEDLNIGYLNARQLHPAMARVAGVRASIGQRTIFNLLGPLTNPAGVRRQVVGVPDATWMRPMAEALRQLGAEHAWVVHGRGLCDLTVTGRSSVIELKDDGVRPFDVGPEDVGLERFPVEDLLVSSPAESAAAIREVFAGAPGARRSQVLMNAASGLVVAGACGGLAEAVQRCAEVIDRGAAWDLLIRWAELQAKQEGQ